MYIGHKMSVAELTIPNNFDLNIHNLNLNGVHLQNGQLIIGSTGAPPLPGNITSRDGSITITNGSGTIDMSVMGGTGTLSTLTTTNPTTSGGAPHWNMDNNTSLRWQHDLITVETGANSGSNYILYAIADDGVTKIGSALIYNRASLSATFGGTVAGTQLIVNAAKSVTIDTLTQTQSVLVNFPNIGTFESNFIIQDAVSPQTINSQLALSAIAGNRVIISSPTQLLAGLALTNGQLIIGQTGGAPAAGNITSNAGTLAITNGPNTINIDIATPPNTFNNILTTAGTSGGGTAHWDLETSGKMRWEWGLKNLESGTNTGSDLILSCYGDSGSSIIYQPLLITRATGNAYFSQGVTLPLISGLTFGNTSGHQTVIYAADPSPFTNTIVIPASTSSSGDTFCLISSTQNLQNKTFVDPGDNTKKINLIMTAASANTQLNLQSSLTSSATINFTYPGGASDSVAYLNSSQTISNKTITSSTFSYTGTSPAAIQLNEAGDTKPRVQHTGDGIIAWGSGSATTDTTLQRISSAALILAGSSTLVPATLLVNNVTAAIGNNNLSISGNGAGVVSVGLTGMQFSNNTSSYSPDSLGYCEYSTNGAISGSNPLTPVQTMTFVIYRIGRHVTMSWTNYIFSLGNANIQFVGVVSVRFLPGALKSFVIFGRNSGTDQPILMNVNTSGLVAFYDQNGNPFVAGNGGFYSGSVSWLFGV